MKRFLASLLTILIFAPFATAQLSGSGDPILKDDPVLKDDPILKKLDSLQKTLDSINASFRKELDTTKSELKALREEISTLKSELEAARKGPLENSKKGPPDIFEDDGSGAYRINGKIVPRDEYFRKLKSLPPIIPFPLPQDKKPIKVVSNPPEQNYAKIKIINTYSTIQTIDVNYETYKVNPGETLMVDYIMPGEFCYKVHGIHKTLQTRKISPHEVFTVTIYPEPPSTTKLSYSCGG
jgi:hypothetical protein